MKHFLLLVIGSGGDFLPMLGLAKKIRAEGHKVTLISNHHYKNMSIQEGIDYLSIDDKHMSDRLLKEKDHVKGFRGYFKYYRTFQIPHIKPLIEKLKPLDLDEKTILLNHYVTHFIGQFITEYFSIKSILVFGAPSGLHSVSNGFLNIATKELTKDLNALKVSLGLEPISNRQEFLFNNIDLYIGLWPTWYQLEEMSAVPIHFTGFYIGENLTPVPDNYTSENNVRKPVLITHGSSVPPNKKYFQICTDACTNLKIPALLVTKHKEYAPDNLSEYIEHHEFIDFNQIMNDISILIHHGGIMTLAHAIKNRVPQIILPHIFDQPDNAKRLEILKLGRFLDEKNWTHENMKNCIEQIINTNTIQLSCKEHSKLLETENCLNNTYQVIDEYINDKTSTGEFFYSNVVENKDNAYQYWQRHVLKI